jgi:hypothetical protein
MRWRGKDSGARAELLLLNAAALLAFICRIQVFDARRVNYSADFVRQEALVDAFV